MSAEPNGQVDLFAPSLVEATTRRLRDDILSGALEPGARLIEEQICQRFSISRAPLRESLRLLVQQGLVEPLRRRLVSFSPDRAKRGSGHHDFTSMTCATSSGTAPG